MAERIDQFQDYQTKLSEILSMNPFIKELEEQAKTIEHLRQRIDQLESSNINQSNIYPYSNYQSSFNNHIDSTDDDLKDEIKSLRERVFELDADLLIQNKENTDDDFYVKSSRMPLKSKRNNVTRDIQIPMSPYHSDKPKDIRLEVLPEILKPVFHNNSQYIPSQIHKRSRSRSETRSSLPSQPQPVQINTPVSPKRPYYHQKLTSNNSSASSQSINNYLSDDDSEDNKYVGEQNIIEHSSNIDQSREETITSHDDLCKCNKCVAAQMREIEFYRSKLRANR
ncbi:676_t:CDS:2 [Dentiscutata erythropus]|uniref:676_t:CDS:1 n=1 Tax=Dentiscutata erythropus TaxID=1348616 RepID=A0A9N8VZ65_9GLOM|nr:676_t:CDS:2 [Dentiscutata erythropus]